MLLRLTPFIDNVLFALERFSYTHVPSDFSFHFFWLSFWVLGTLFAWAITTAVVLLLKLLNTHFKNKKLTFELSIARLGLVCAVVVGLAFTSLLITFFSVVYLLNVLYPQGCIMCSPTDVILVVVPTFFVSSFAISLVISKVLRKKFTLLWRIITASLSSIGALTLLFGLIFIWLFKPCHSALFSKLVFNQHLKELCLLRADTSECPKNEAELRAFNPDKYDLLLQCAEVEYSYNSTTKKVIWEIEPYSNQDKFSNFNVFPDFTRDEHQRYEALQIPGGDTSFNQN